MNHLLNKKEYVYVTGEFNAISVKTTEVHTSLRTDLELYGPLRINVNDLNLIIK